CSDSVQRSFVSARSVRDGLGVYRSRAAAWMAIERSDDFTNAIGGRCVASPLISRRSNARDARVDSQRPQRDWFCRRAMDAVCLRGRRNAQGLAGEFEAAAAAVPALLRIDCPFT